MNRRLTLVCYQYLRLIGGVEANFASTFSGCSHRRANADGQGDAGGGWKCGSKNDENCYEETTVVLIV